MTDPTPTFTILVGSIGRPTLERTIESFVGQRGREVGDQLIVVFDTHMPGGVPMEEVARAIDTHWAVNNMDRGVTIGGYDSGYHHLGVEQINWAWRTGLATGSHITTMGDDDILVQGALERLREAATPDPDRPIIYRFLSPWRAVLPPIGSNGVQVSRISGCCLMAPRRFNAEHPTDRIAEHDYHWIQGVVGRASEAGCEPVWLDDILVVARPDAETDAMGLGQGGV